MTLPRALPIPHCAAGFRGGSPSPASLSKLESLSGDKSRANSTSLTAPVGSCSPESMPRPKAYHRKRGSASYIVREVLSVREREIQRERERRRWRHHCRAIGDEFALSLAKNSHNWRWAYTFPCQKFALFVSPFTLPVSPFTERSPLWRWNSQWVHTFHCQNFFALFVPPLSNGTSRTMSDRKPKTNDQILPSPILFFPSKKWIKLIPKTIGNRKRDCAWGGSTW